MENIHLACNSLSCNRYGCDYCKKCSHAIYKSDVRLNNKVYRWEFRPHYGVIFLKKDRTPYKKQPSEKHMVWKLFHEWHNKHFK
jgi:hypothetical protein